MSGGSSPAVFPDRYKSAEIKMLWTNGCYYETASTAENHIMEKLVHAGTLFGLLLSFEQTYSRQRYQLELLLRPCLNMMKAIKIV